MYILHFTPHHPSPHHHHQNPDNDHHHLLDEYVTEDNQSNCSYCLQEQEEQVSSTGEERGLEVQKDNYLFQHPENREI